jgi:hypothetical protein
MKESYSFSAVEVDDIHKMDMSRAGVLELHTNVQKATPSDHFNYFISRIQERWNMKVICFLSTFSLSLTSLLSRKFPAGR